MIRQNELAKQFGVSVGLISLIKKGDRFTKNRYLAMEISRLSGRPPIDHIFPDLREVYLRAYPELRIQMKN